MTLQSVTRPLMLAAAIASLTALLGGCTTTQGPLFGPDSPRDGATRPVDPIYGTPIPGYVTPFGGAFGAN
jgi:hypothetical protein